MGNQNLWHKLCAAFDIDPETQGMATNAERVANRPAVISVIEERFRDYTAEELLEKLADAGIPSGIVRSLQEVYQWEQALSQGLKTVSYTHLTLPTILLV